MKRKTSLYLEKEDLQELKRISLKEPDQKMTSLIQRAIRQFIDNRKERTKSFEALRKCKSSVKENYFGDGVSLQRKLREEWED